MIGLFAGDPLEPPHGLLGVSGPHFENHCIIQHSFWHKQNLGFNLSTATVAFFFVLSL